MSLCKRNGGLCLAALFVLAACAPAPTVTPKRDISAPIGATSRFDPVAFSGEWRVFARFEPAAPASLAVSRNPQDGILQLASSALPEISGSYRVGVPGELIPLSATQESLIVFWVDEDFETAAIGTPSGRFGALIDRDGIIPKDREQAARDIFAFYGWNVSALRRIEP